MNYYLLILAINPKNVTNQPLAMFCASDDAFQHRTRSAVFPDSSIITRNISTWYYFPS